MGKIKRNIYPSYRIMENKSGIIIASEKDKEEETDINIDSPK